MATNKAQANLRDVLASLYIDEQSARRVIADSGLDERRISISNHSSNTWHAILTEAAQVGRIQAVVDIATHEYQDNIELRKAVAAWLHKDEVADTSLVVDMPIDFDWVTIPAGEFLMGSDQQRDSSALPDELPQHTVYLPEFHISRVPVTTEQYQMFVDATGREASKDMKHGHPVTWVPWDDVQEFCRWAKVRLPTEAEWEKAARGSDGRIYPWGDDPPSASFCNFSGNEDGPTLVGKYPKGASPYGLLDIAGNVWEWTSSLYWDYPYNALDGRESNQIRTPRTLRGGSWNNPGLKVRCASRFMAYPRNSGHGGFRVVMSSSRF